MIYSEGPDKGHAWVIAIAACVITMILSGISKMVGILYVAVIDTYDTTRFEATLPFTFRKSLRSSAGIVVGVIGQRYGIRTVTLWGGVIAALGAGLCFVAPTVTWLAVCWGGIHGLGEAFANTLFQVVVNQYFVKYRSTASGIALSGACVGSICFSFLIEALRDAYGLQGTFLILSGIILNVLPAAILLKSPSWIRNSIKPVNQKDELPNHSNQESLPQKPRPNMVHDSYVKLNAKKMSATSLTPPLLEKNEIFSVANAPLKAVSATNLTSSFEEKLKSEERCDNLSFSSENEINKVSLEKRLSIQNIFPMPEESSDRQTSRNDLHEESLKKEIETKQENSHPEKPKSLLENMKTIVRLYKNPIFILLCVCNATYVLIFIPIMTSAVDYARDKGLPEHIGKYLIHAMAVGDIFGRLCFGWVTDKSFMTIPHYMILTLVLEGVFIVLLPLTTSLATYLLLLALYSMTAGSMMVRIPVLVYKHVKKDEKSVAMGCYGFASGLVPLGVPSLIGYFRDNKGSYDGMYYIMGSLSILSGGFWLLEPILVRLSNKLELHREDSIKV